MCDLGTKTRIMVTKDWVGIKRKGKIVGQRNQIFSQKGGSSGALTYSRLIIVVNTVLDT